MAENAGELSILAKIFYRVIDIILGIVLFVVPVSLMFLLFGDLIDGSGVPGLGVRFVILLFYLLILGIGFFIHYKFKESNYFKSAFLLALVLAFLFYLFPLFLAG